MEEMEFTAQRLAEIEVDLLAHGILQGVEDQFHALSRLITEKFWEKYGA